MTDNLKRAEEFYRKSVYFFFTVSVLDFYISNTLKFSLISSKKPTMHARNKKSPARYMPANCAEISKVTSDGGNWILRDFGTFRSESVRSELRLLYSFMKNKYEKLIARII